ncbi:MAG: xanthine dehydrogenase family protein subunit M [Desulfurococcales archaeon]|nr:xanthine dehydrogenase family protein subunit M [Desulfurococcales archaeon]
MAQTSIKPSRHNLYNTHIIPVSFEYFAPANLQEALELLDKYGADAKILAGGTDLLVKMKMRVVEPKYVINIKKLKELAYIKEEGNVVRIGALTKWRQLEKSDIIKKYFPALYDAVLVMAGTQIRNMATIGGNLCNASPAADSAPPLMVYEAKVVLASKDGEREVPITEFFTGPGRTVMKPNELLKEIVIPKPEEGTGSAFIKVTRTAMDLAKISAATALKVEDGKIKLVRIAIGSAAPTPVRCRKTEEALTGKPFTPELIRETVKMVQDEISPIDDVRSTAFYRKEVSKVIVEDALMISHERVIKGWFK